MRLGRLGWLFCLLLALAPLHAGAATYVMTSITANWIDASGHNKITANSTPYRFTGGGSTGCGSTPPTLDDVISQAPLVRCDEVQFRFLGVSMAGWNAILSLSGAAAIIFLTLKGSRR